MPSVGDDDDVAVLFTMPDGSKAFIICNIEEVAVASSTVDWRRALSGGPGRPGGQPVTSGPVLVLGGAVKVGQGGSGRSRMQWRAEQLWHLTEARHPSNRTSL